MKKIAIVASVVVFCVFSGLIVKHQVEVKAEKQRFQTTRKWLEDVADEITKANNKTIKDVKAYCRRNSVKFGRGERSCAMIEYILYTDSTAAQEDIDSIESAIKPLITSQLYSATPRSDFDELKNYSFNVNDLQCSRVLYDNTKQPLHSLPNISYTDSEGILVYIGCSGPAMADYFPSKS